MCKINKIPSEIRNFFSEKRSSQVMEVFTRLIESLSVDSKVLGGVKRDNCRMTNLQVFQILILMPFFALKGFSHYPGSVLNRMFGGKKDMFYSFMAQDNVDWRGVVYRIVTRLIGNVVIRKDYRSSHLPTVLIGDDSDLPKTGLRMEAIGRIFSHVHQKCCAFIQNAVAESKASRIIVATHHVPSFVLMSPEFKNSSINGAFTVELGRFIADSPIDYWIYGHSHRNIDKTIGNTKCVSNQLGYVFQNEHLSFRPDAIIEV